MASKRWRKYRLTRTARGRLGSDTSKLTTTPDDLEVIRKSIEDASSVSAGLWLSYLFVLFYFAVGAGAVTHTDLLLESPVKLPFLNIELPLVAFFFLAPMLFIVMHAYTMVHFVLLAKKAIRFDNRLYEQIPRDDDRSASIRDGQRQQLPSNIFVQFLAGPSEIRDAGFGRLLKLIAWTTLVFGPIALLLLLQMQFLPFHHALITWTHRIAVITDLLLVWWLWRKIIGDDLGGWRTRKTSAKVSIALAASLGVVLFSWTVATFPGEWQEEPLKWFTFLEPTRMNATIFNGDVDSITRRRTSWSSNTLVLPGFNFDEAQKGELKEHSIDLRGRHLEGAVFAGAKFGMEADFTGAYLQGASLAGAQLQGAWFVGTRLLGASLQDALLQGALLDGARLQGASLSSAHLEGASLEGADLEGTRLDYAHLQGASLFGARLHGTTLSFSELFGASFEKADLFAVDMSLSFLWRSKWNETSARSLWTEGASWEPRVLRFAPSGGVAEMLVSQGFIPWSNESYALLKKEIESIPKGDHRTLALQRIAQLDCSDPTLTPCNQTTPMPEVFGSAVESNEDAYDKALAEILGKLVCDDPMKHHLGGTLIAPPLGSSDSDAITILRGLMNDFHLNFTGHETSALIARFQRRDCRVSKLLTGNDRVHLNEFVH